MGVVIPKTISIEKAKLSPNTKNIMEHISREAIIYLEPLFQLPEFPAPTDTVKVDIFNQVFIPHIIAIQVGTVVAFMNNDKLFHSIFSYSQPNKFELGSHAGGAVKTYTFKKPGIVKVYCEIHAQMNMEILISRTPYFTFPNSKGEFKIPNILPGEYRVTVWFSRQKIEKQTITIRPGGIVALNLIL
jgi:plastocyanin